MTTCGLNADQKPTFEISSVSGLFGEWVARSGARLDRAAVEAALSLCWSNGQTEGQVNRLKMLKRQMYGWAGFDFLRARVLPFPAAVSTAATAAA